MIWLTTEWLFSWPKTSLHVTELLSTGVILSFSIPDDHHQRHRMTFVCKILATGHFDISLSIFQLHITRHFVSICSHHRYLFLLSAPLVRPHLTCRLAVIFVWTVTDDIGLLLALRRWKSGANGLSNALLWMHSVRRGEIGSDLIRGRRQQNEMYLKKRGSIVCFSACPYAVCEKETS